MVWRVYADGRPDELVRGVDIVGTPLLSLNNIILTGRHAASIQRHLWRGIRTGSRGGRGSGDAVLRDRSAEAREGHATAADSAAAGI